jgi:hypothetical protein
VARLVRDPDIEATANLHYVAMTEATARCQRVVIHPSLAFQFLDRLPAVARLYERQRRHPLLSSRRKTSKPISVPELFASTLRHGIRKHVGSPEIADSEHRFANGALSRLVNFPRLVLTHSALGLNDVPSVTATLRCAKTFVSESFAAALAHWYFRFPWAKACDFRGCETLLPSASLSEPGATLRIQRGRVFAEPTNVNGTQEVEWIGLQDASSEASSAPGTESTETSNAYNFTWTPWEHLVTGLCDDAITLSLGGQRPPLAEPFRGSMQRGIAWKETIRARARGENGLYVHSEPTAEALQPADPSEGWPVVWIFDADGRGDSTWKDYVVPMSWLVPFLHPTARQGRRDGVRRRGLEVTRNHRLRTGV